MTFEEDEDFMNPNEFELDLSEHFSNNWKTSFNFSDELREER